MKFRRLCRRAGIAPSRVALLAKVSPATITRWKRVGRVKHNTATKLARTLRVPVAEFQAKVNGRARRGGKALLDREAADIVEAATEREAQREHR